MSALEVVDAYLASRRALGVRMDSGAPILRQFVRETGNVPLSEVTPEAVARFLRGRGALSATWRTKYRVLAGLFRFAIVRGHAEVSPLPEHRPQLPPQQTPYVYSSDELQRLLDATALLRERRSGVQETTYRTLLLLLYGAGLRISEGIGLTLRDVDLAERILTVRDTKFYKTRLVPIGPRLTAALAAYLEQRSTLAMPEGSCSAFLCSRTGERLKYDTIIRLFQRIRSAARIDCPPGELRPPRLHDLRHAAAVHRVLAWYRAGEDVQRLFAEVGDLSGSRGHQLDTTLPANDAATAGGGQPSLCRLRAAGGRA